jgi:hypothetical protein
VPGVALCVGVAQVFSFGAALAALRAFARAVRLAVSYTVTAAR